jgi:hypothetical protein
MKLESCRALDVANDSERGTASSCEAEHPTALPPAETQGATELQTKAENRANGSSDCPSRLGKSRFRIDSAENRRRLAMSDLESCRDDREIHRESGLSAGVLSRKFWSFVARLAILYWSLVAQTNN